MAARETLLHTRIRPLPMPIRAYVHRPRWPASPQNKTFQPIIATARDPLHCHPQIVDAHPHAHARLCKQKSRHVDNSPGNRWYWHKRFVPRHTGLLYPHVYTRRCKRAGASSPGQSPPLALDTRTLAPRSCCHSLRIYLYLRLDALRGTWAARSNRQLCRDLAQVQRTPSRAS